MTRTQASINNKNIVDSHTDINEFKKSYRPRSNLAKNWNCIVPPDCHSILNGCENYLSQMLTERDDRD